MPKILFCLNLISVLICIVPFINYPAAAMDGVVAISENENGTTIFLAKGQLLQLSLTANPSTGYTWQAVKQPDPGVMTQISHYLQPRANLPGSPATEFWIYQTAGRGSTLISLKYSRNWLPNVPPLKTYLVNVVVKH